MKQKRKKIAAILSLGLLLLAFPALAQWSTSNYTASGLPTGTIYNIIRALMNWLLAIFAFVGIIGFVISGIQYLTAAGDDEQQKRAKKSMYYSIMGVLVGLAGLVLITAINSLLNATSNTF